MLAHSRSKGGGKRPQGAVRKPPHQSSRAPIGTDVHVALAIDADLLLLDIAGHSLGVLDGALADLDLLLDRDANLLALAEIARGGPAGRGAALDDDLLALDRHVDRLALGGHVL